MMAMPAVSATRSVQRNPCPSIMCPTNVALNLSSQSYLTSCENSTAYAEMSDAIATTDSLLRTSTMRQQQKTIMDHRASPQASGSQPILLDRRPMGISTRMAQRYVSLVFFIYIVRSGPFEVVRPGSNPEMQFGYAQVHAGVADL